MKDWKNLSLREKIGQTMLMLPGTPVDFDRYPVTGFFMGWKLWDGVQFEDRVTHIRNEVVRLQAASRLPLLFQEDYEAGLDLPGMTALPNEMALGAARSPELAHAYGRTVALECRSVGINWVLHPVADLNLNPHNPIASVRSLTDDPDLAIRLLSEQVRGLQQNGVAATIKHFPGDGVDFRDQHLVTTCNSLSWDDWNRLHGRVFQALIDQGVATIMPGHISLPAWQKAKLNGHFPPATLSHELLTGLLKQKMGFGGVIVSDAMTMGGFRGWYSDPLEGEIQSFLAGVDIMLWPSFEFLDEVERRILDGRIPMERLDDAVSRVCALKEKLGLFEPKRSLFRELSAGERAQGQQAARSVAEHAVQLVRDRHGALPLHPEKDKKVLVLAVAPVSRKDGTRQVDQLRSFADALRHKGFDVTFQHNLLYETQGWTDDSPARYDRIVVAVTRSPHTPFGPLQFWDDEAQSVWGINALPKEKIVLVNFGSPYLTDMYFERVDTCLNAFSNTALLHGAVCRVLTGELEATGVCPVAMPKSP